MKYTAAVILALILAGCSASRISLDEYNLEDDFYSMKGQTLLRSFVYNTSIGTELKPVWDESLHGSFPATTIVYRDNFLFVANQSGRIYCLDLYTGDEAGMLKEKGVLETAPVIKSDLIIFPLIVKDELRTRLIFYNYVKGVLTEEVSINGLVKNELVLTGKYIYALTELGTLFKFNFSGEELFKIKTDRSVHSDPIMIDNRIIFGNDRGELTAVDAAGGTILKRTKISGEKLNNITAYCGTLLIGGDDGILYNVDPETFEVIWRYDNRNKIKVTPVCSNDDIFIADLGGKITALDYNGKVKWAYETGSVISVEPILFINTLIAGGLDANIYFLDRSQGDLLKKYEFDNRISMIPFYKDGLLLIGYDRNNLEAYEVE